MSKTIEEKIANGYYSHLVPPIRMVLRIYDQNGSMGIENLASDTKTSIITTKDLMVQLQGKGHLTRTRSKNGEEYSLTNKGKQYAEDTLDKLSHLHEVLENDK